MTAGTGLSIAVLQHEPETALGVFSEVLDEVGVTHHLVETASAVSLPDVTDFDGVIVLGGSLAAHDPALDETRRWLGDAALKEIPVFGVCLGGQLLAAALGGAVGRACPPEAGIHDVYLTRAGKNDPLFAGLPGRLPVFGWHEDAFELPQGAIPLAGSIACEHQAFRFGSSVYGLQFHTELRPDDLRRWAAVPGYAALLARTSARWDDVAAELEQFGSELEALARLLLARWLYLVTDRAELRAQRTRIAV
jgi:GMP synthase (glutamine-hydrolysing)